MFFKKGLSLVEKNQKIIRFPNGYTMFFKKIQIKLSSHKKTFKSFKIVGLIYFVVFKRVFLKGGDSF